jgi:hypothetical protein
VEIIEQECANAVTPATIRRAFWMLLRLGCWIYTLCLFDTLGDAMGFYTIRAAVLPALFCVCGGLGVSIYLMFDR